MTALTMKPIVLNCWPVEVPRARRAVRYNLANYPSKVALIAEQCASEIVTNAILHSKSKTNSGTIMLVILKMEDRIRIEVIDDGSDEDMPEVIEDSGEDEENGRGLFIVKTLSSACGTHVDESGRNVWFEVNIY